MKNYLGIHYKCNIRKNIISTNQNGIEIYSSDPFISENQIRRNYKNGGRVTRKRMGEWIGGTREIL